MKLLDGKELAEFIEERQSRQVRALRQAWNVAPKLAIVVTVDNPVINVYTRMKKKYGADVLIDVDIHQVKQDNAAATIQELNADPSVHGIIVQLPLERPEETEQIVNLVTPEKDVDGLGTQATLDPATPMAILWLLAGYGVELKQAKKVVIVGRGRLVGGPLERMMKASGIEVASVDQKTKDIMPVLIDADVVISATGSPALLKPDMIKQGAVVVDAGVAGEKGEIIGDVAPEMYDRDDLTITPKKGGVGPLTICALFENVIRAARQVAESRS